MDVAVLDYWATQGKSSYHRAAPWAKVSGAGLMLIAVLATHDLFSLLAQYLLVVSAVILTGLPALRILSFALYPAIFAIPFAISQWEGSFILPALLILRAVTVAQAMVLLIVTTPYPETFTVLRRFLGPVLSDALFLTYRSLFLLLDLFRHLLLALRLRCGLRPHHLAQNLRNMAQGLGLLLIEAMALSERLYAVLRVRGYSGRLVLPRQHPFTRCDLMPLALGGLLLAAAGAARIADSRYAFGGALLLALPAAFLLRPRAGGGRW